MTPGHDNDWTVRTLKEHFDALRAEDQKAIVLLSIDLGGRLDRITSSFENLKTSVDRFHAAIAERETKGKWDFGVIINIATLVIAAGVLIGTWVNHQALTDERSTSHSNPSPSFHSGGGY